MPDSAGQKLRASRVRMLANEDIFSSIGASSLSTTSGTYTDITGATKSFTKIGDASESDLIIDVSLSGFVTSTGTGFKVGVNINGTTYDATSLLFNTANAHAALPTGSVRVNGLPAGTYTVKLRALRTTGAGTLSIDSSDTVTFKMKERAI